MLARITTATILSLTALLALAACDSKPPTPASPAPKHTSTAPAPSTTTPAPTDAATTQTVAKVDESEWCGEHGVPESICTRCHPKLIAEFKQKGDWCKEHNLPESQCIACDPTLKDKLAAMKPAGK